ncbi:MAG: hypothetical protein R3F14_14030 [Polyangiaceae bacterium]
MTASSSSRAPGTPSSAATSPSSLASSSPSAPSSAPSAPPPPAISRPPRSTRPPSVLCVLRAARAVRVFLRAACAVVGSARRRSPRRPPLPAASRLSSTPDPASSIALSGLFVGAGALLTGAVLLPLGLEELGRADALYRDITSRAGTTAPCTPLSDYREACAEHRALSTDGAALANAGLTSLLAGAGLAAAAGGFLLLRSPVAGAGPGGPRVTVGGGPDGAFVALKGVF